MKNRNVRSSSSGASLLTIALLTGALCQPFLTAATFAQTASPPQQQQVATDSAKKQQAAKADRAAKSKQSTASPAPPAENRADKPLAPNEDPALIGKRNINKGFDKWIGGSQAKEVAMGRMYAAEVEKDLKLVDDPVITEYVNRVGQNIVNHSDAKVPFTIKVVDSDEVNAFALPGGFFYVNRGLLLAADNEAELAAVMAHEIGHVCARHVVEHNGKQQLISYGMLGAILATGGIAGSILYNTQGLLQGLIGARYSRGAEEEADRLGLQYMYAAGYDPTQMAAMFEKLEAINKKKSKGLMKLLMSHPESLERRGSSIALAARFPERDEYVLDTSQFESVKAHLLKLTNAKASITGDVDSDGSGRPTLKRRQPENPADSTVAPPNGDTTKSEDKTPPKLKRRDAEITSSPAPSPSPQK